MTIYIYYCFMCHKLSENKTGEEYIACPHCGHEAKRTGTRAE